MGQEERGVPEAPALGAGQREQGIGRFLARERSLRGISLDELAELTKIPRRSLERLESGAFDAHRDGFARGFVRTVAEALGLDPDQAVMRLMNEPPADEAGARAGAGLSLPPPALRLAAAAALLLAALLGWWVFAGGRGAAPEPAESDVLLRRDAVRDLVRERAAGAEAAGRGPGGAAAASAGEAEPPASPEPVDAAGPEPGPGDPPVPARDPAAPR
jgi:transcriptional regulator with XRE-family HTH domain